MFRDPRAAARGFMHDINVVLGHSGLARVDAEPIVGIVSKRRSRAGLEFLVNVVPCMGRVANSTNNSASE